MLDEPPAGLHPCEVKPLPDAISDLTSRGNITLADAISDLTSRGNIELGAAVQSGSGYTGCSGR